MESMDPECTDAKKKYESCFQAWYSEKYLPATDHTKVTDDCKDLFVSYRRCIDRVLREKGIDKMIEEFRKSSFNEA